VIADKKRAKQKRAIAKIDGKSCVKPLDIFKNVVPSVSAITAKNKYNQCIL
jgi:hypothetical protein